MCVKEFKAKNWTPISFNLKRDTSSKVLEGFFEKIKKEIVNYYNISVSFNGKHRICV